jgi:hypothetical protein
VSDGAHTSVQDEVVRIAREMPDDAPDRSLADGVKTALDTVSQRLRLAPFDERVSRIIEVGRYARAIAHSARS